MLQRTGTLHKKLGVKHVLKNLYPDIEFVVPGFLPATPAQELLPDLVHILDQSIWVVRQAETKGKEFIHDKDGDDFHCYFRIPESTNDVISWKEKMIPLSGEMHSMGVRYNGVNLDRFLKLPPCRDVLEMEL